MHGLMEFQDFMALISKVQAQHGLSKLGALLALLCLKRSVNTGAVNGTFPINPPIPTPLSLSVFFMPLHHTQKLIDFICATQANIQREPPDLWNGNHLAALILPLCQQPPESDKRNQAVMGYLLGSK